MSRILNVSDIPNSLKAWSPADLNVQTRPELYEIPEFGQEQELLLDMENPDEIQTETSSDFQVFDFPSVQDEIKNNKASGNSIQNSAGKLVSEHVGYREKHNLGQGENQAEKQLEKKPEQNEKHSSQKKIYNRFIQKERFQDGSIPNNMVSNWEMSNLADENDLESPEDELMEHGEKGHHITSSDVEHLVELKRGYEKEITLAKQQIETARAEAEELLKNGRETASLLMEEVNNQIEHIKQNAYKQGIEAAKSDAANVLKLLEQIITDAKMWREQTLAQSESTIIGMIKLIGKKLFGGGLNLDAKGVEEMVGRAISEGSRLGNLRVYVNQADEELLVSLWQETEVMVNGQKIQLVPSQKVLPGGCFIEGEFGTLDSRIESQIELIEKEITNTLENSDREQEVLK
ncbi:MAG: FliH/SctL family protein [Leptolinea sp.]